MAGRCATSGRAAGCSNLFENHPQHLRCRPNPCSLGSLPALRFRRLWANQSGQHPSAGCEWLLGVAFEGVLYVGTTVGVTLRYARGLMNTLLGEN